MSATRVTRKTHYSRKHLASDFDWEGLEGLSFPATGLQDKRADDLLPKHHEQQQGHTAEPTKFDPQLFTFPPPGDVLNTPDSRPPLTSLIICRW